MYRFLHTNSNLILEVAVSYVNNTNQHEKRVVIQPFIKVYCQMPLLFHYQTVLYADNTLDISSLLD